MEIHERALMNLGYMEERRFETDIGGKEAARELFVAFGINSTLYRRVVIERPMARIVDVGSTFVVVRSAREDMPKWEALLAETRVSRRADMGHLLVPKINEPEPTK